MLPISIYTNKYALLLIKLKGNKKFNEKKNIFSIASKIKIIFIVYTQKNILADIL